MSTDTFTQLVKAIVDGKKTVSSAADELYADLTQDEKLALLDGDHFPMQWIAEVRKFGYCGVPVVAGAIARKGFPGIRFSDGPRGVNMGTCFPTPSTRANAFNVELEEAVVSAHLLVLLIWLILSIREGSLAESFERLAATTLAASASISPRTQNGDDFKSLSERIHCWSAR